MRTKALVCAAAVAAMAISAMAQPSNVYSLNVVGYVNKSFQNGYFTMVGNPLKNGGNDLNAILTNAPAGSQVWTWNVGSQDFDGALGADVPTYVSGTGWVPNPVLDPGKGFFFVAAADYTATFVGEVLQGSLTNTLAGNFAFEAVSSQVPIGGSLTNALAGYPALAGDQIWTWNVAAQDLDGALGSDVPTYVTGTGWVPDANIPVGDGFFVVRSGTGVTWVRNFTVQ